jgi:hypothetical protein
MTYSIISLLNISFVNKRCMKMTISTNKGCKVGMTAIWRCCVLSHTKSHKNVTLYCWFKLMLSEYNYIHFTQGLLYWIRTAHTSVDNHFNDNWHIKRTKAAYRCTMPHLCRNSTANVNSAALNLALFSEKNFSFLTLDHIVPPGIQSIT